MWVNSDKRKPLLKVGVHVRRHKIWMKSNLDGTDIVTVSHPICQCTCRSADRCLGSPRCSSIGHWHCGNAGTQHCTRPLPVKPSRLDKGGVERAPFRLSTPLVATTKTPSRGRRSGQAQVKRRWRAPGGNPGR